MRHYKTTRYLVKIRAAESVVTTFRTTDF